MKDEFNHLHLFSKKTRKKETKNSFEIYIYGFIFFLCFWVLWRVLVGIGPPATIQGPGHKSDGGCVMLQRLTNWQPAMQDTKWFAFSESSPFWMPASCAFRGTADDINFKVIRVLLYHVIDVQNE